MMAEIQREVREELSSEGEMHCRRISKARDSAEVLCCLIVYWVSDEEMVNLISCYRHK